MEYTSERASTDSPRACSGDRYCAVPMTAAVWVTVAGVVRYRPRDAEVHDLDRAGAGDHDVRRLDVAVHDPVAVAEVQGAAHLGDDLHGAPRRQPSLGLEDVAQRPALDVLHHDVRHLGVAVRATVVLAGVVDRHDRRVVQAGRGLRLATEPVQERRVAREVGAQHLDRDIAAETHVAPAMHLGHAAVADELAELVPAPDQSRGVVIE